MQAAIPTIIVYLLVNRIGPLQVRSYGVMMLGAFAAALTCMYLDRDRYDFTRLQVLQVALLGFAGGILGGRLGFVALNWSDYAAEVPAVMDLWQGGMSWHGGLAGGLLTIAIAAPLIGVSFARCFDLAAPGLAVGYAVARVGCYLNGCCYGIPSTHPWAVTFPQVGGRMPESSVHPTQFYAAAGALVFVLPLLLLLTPYLKKPFNRFLGFVALYSVLRYVVEAFRREATAEVLQIMPVFTIGQAASVLLFALALIVIVLRERHSRGDAASE